MAKLIDDLRQRKENKGLPSAQELAAETLRSAMIALADGVQHQLVTIYKLAAAHGMANILATMTQEEQDGFSAHLLQFKALWESASDKPFPVLPDQPLPTPPPDPDPGGE